MRILGLSAFYHDSAAALLEDGNIVAAAQEERFTRKKHDAGFPSCAVRYCLDEAGLAIADLDAIVFYDKPFLKFERLLETYYASAPKGFTSFAASMPVWIKEKLFQKKMIKDALEDIAGGEFENAKLLFSEHHLSHAASAFYPSPFRDAAVVTIDGVGEYSTASIFQGSDKGFFAHRELHFPHSLGLLYSAFTYFLGFKVNSGEYKLMGLAPYGDPDSPRTRKFEETILTNLVTLFDDGSVRLNQDYFNYATGLTMVNESEWNRLFGFSSRKPESDILSEHCDLALAIQRVTEKAVLKIATYAKEITGAKHLCLAGGVALNCVANGKLLKAGIFDDIWIQPAAGDAGGALGAAYAAHHIYFGKPKANIAAMDGMRGSYLGPSFSNRDVVKGTRKYKAVYERFTDQSELAARVAGYLKDGAVIGWFQGRMEWGPRALGNRSIIADARSPEMQKKLNLKIKYREGFRPFAPSVLFEDVAEYFELESSSPYMLLVADVQGKRRIQLPVDYHAMPLKDKLYFLRSDIPSVTHLDYSARIQTVHKETNPRYWNLIKAFKELTHFGVLVNTSFNVRGEPIVCTPEDAYRCFMRTEMDYLVVEDVLFDKKQQHPWEERGNWRDEYGLD